MDKKIKMFSGIAITLSMMTAVGTSALAMDSSLPQTAASASSQKNSGLSEEVRNSIRSAMEESQKSALAALVKAGTITQEQMDKILAHDRNAVQSLTDEQKEKVKSAMMQAFQDALDKLVKDGTITKDQAEKMKSGFHERRERQSKSSAG